MPKNVLEFRRLSPNLLQGDVGLVLQCCRMGRVCVKKIQDGDGEGFCVKNDCQDLEASV